MTSIKVPKYVNTKPKITVCVPTRGIIFIDFVDTLLPLLTTDPYWCDLNVVVRRNRHSVAAVRNSLAKDALKAGADYLFFIDDDMLFDGITPIDAIKKLYDLNAPIASGVCRTRINGVPIWWFKRHEHNRNSRDEYKQFGNIFEALGVGMYCTLIKREVFDKMQAPYFEYWPYDGGDDMVTEDEYFMNKANELGYKVKVRKDVRLNHIVTMSLNADGETSRRLVG